MVVRQTSISEKERSIFSPGLECNTVKGPEQENPSSNSFSKTLRLRTSAHEIKHVAVSLVMEGLGLII